MQIFYYVIIYLQRIFNLNIFKSIYNVPYIANISVTLQQIIPYKLYRIIIICII